MPVGAGGLLRRDGVWVGGVDEFVRGVDTNIRLRVPTGLGWGALALRHVHDRRQRNRGQPA